MPEPAAPAPRRRWSRLKRAKLEDRSARILGAILLLAGAAVWLTGALLLPRVAGAWASAWNALWAVAGVAFLGSFAIPVPGATTALFLALHSSFALAFAAVLGAAPGGTFGAALMLLAGRALRRRLDRRAKKGRFYQAFLKAATRLVHRFTYAGVALLLAIPFVPRAIVLYAASLLHLRPVPQIVAVLGGHLVRYSILMAIIVGAVRF